MRKYLGAALFAIVFVLTAGVLYATRNQTPLPTPSLRELAMRYNIQLGAYAARDRLDERAYVDVLTSQFHFVVIDGQPNWHFEDGSLRPSPEDYDFTRFDEVLEFAESRIMPVRVQHFVWGEEKWLPQWLKDGDYSKAELQEFMKQHIQAFGRRYKDRVREWTVVNEAFTRGEHRYGLNDWWRERIGPEYISQAFVWAHEADPDAVLILNDFGNEVRDSASDAMYKQVVDMQEQGIPIDAIGMQMHIDGTKPPTKEATIENMRRFGERGIQVYVTEFDVNMNDVPGTQRDKERVQEDIYYQMMRACIESKVCPSFSILGITDKESWYNEMGVPHAMPLPLDHNYQPKPAFYGLRRALEEY